MQDVMLSFDVLTDVANDNRLGIWHGHKGMALHALSYGYLSLSSTLYLNHVLSLSSSVYVIVRWRHYVTLAKIRPQDNSSISILSSLKKI